MLDSWNMKALQFGAGSKGSASSAHCRLTLRARMIKTCVFLLLISSPLTALHAQQPSQGSNSNCFDPLLAGTPQCVDQNSQQNNPMLAPRTRTAPSAEDATQPRNPNFYSDTENLSRQAATRAQSQPAPLAPEPLTEFQKFAASTTGQILPVFGASLFTGVPSTFSPLDMSPVPPDFVIGPGDELRVRAWGQVNFQTNLRVDRSGEIFLPEIGPVHVAGMPFSALDAHLRSAIGRVYRNFDLTVDVGQIRAIQVYVAGQARRPGVYTVSSLSTLVDALFASGGPSLQGSLRHIQLRRGSTVVADFDLYDLLTSGDKSKDVHLLAGDVVFIPPVGPQVAVTGSVRNPAIYELRENESLAGLLAEAGGVSAVAAEARVSIERIEDHRDRLAMEVAYDPNGLATPLANGDLVRVFSIVPTYRKTVILRGNTANQGRFAWHPGMRVSDLIPDRDSLITRNYWWKRAQLGLPAPEFEPTAGFADMRQPAENHAVAIRPSTPEAISMADQPGLQQDQARPQDNLSAQQRGSSTTLASQQDRVLTRNPRPEQRTEIRLVAPEIDWDYAVIERQDPDTLKTTLISFDLGKLVLQHDDAQNLELQAGDVISIFSEADIGVPIAQQTKLVRLDGEFVHAGSYTVQPGETLRHLVDRAGGLTPNAYLYGSEFTRESVRATQQARIDEYVRTIEMQTQRGNLALASSGASSAQELASGAAAQGSERELMARLSQIRATGRLVLEFKPESQGLGDFPDITMEDGDRIVVPHVPSSVNVVGAVYDQNSFLYAQERRVGMYLRKAGGPTRDADRKHAFIIRADGEVVSRDAERSVWGDAFNNLRIYPGDTLVVPEKTFKPSALRGVLDWSQMFSQFALGAASISLLR
jgi:protein involved in polysaccharide export with SLBB domain